MSYIKERELPKERIPVLYEKDNCFKLKNIKYIHDYFKFNKYIIKPFSTIIKPEIHKKFKNTCDHMFNTIGYGVFIFILNGNIHTFQVFANITKEKLGSKNITKKHLSKIHKYNSKTPKSIKKWSFSNCMINNGKAWWKSGYISVYFNMLQTCLKGTNITTVFFLNLFDYPVLYKKKCPQHINYDILCKNNEKQEDDYIGVLSGATTSEHYDKCIVYADSWELFTQKKFNKKCLNKYYNLPHKLNTNWDTKINSLIFRGKNNSCFMNDFKKNDRLKTLQALYHIKEKNTKITLPLDVGFTKLSPKLTYTQKIDPSNKNKIFKQLKMTTFKNRMSMNEQSNYKFILDIDGYVTPWRLNFELSYNSCILIMMSEYYSWFYSELKHLKNVYIIDINSSDNIDSQLERALLFFQNNDKKCEKIAEGAVDLYNEIMNFEYIQNYMVSLLSEPEFDILLPVQ